MKLIDLIESFVSGDNIKVYHGTSSFLPFSSFDARMIGSGVVHGTQHKGFFFTSELENAEFYSEYFICEVMIENVMKPPIEARNPSKILTLAYENKKNYIIEDVLDGVIYSDIVVVPKNNLRTIKILNWKFIGDKDYIFEKWDNFFGGDEEYIFKDMIRETLNLIDLDINYLLDIPIFSEYYESKG